ncbi:MAG TPA: long-chain fatty acid--CoA ligase [Rectinemataceae bacterium]|nr:long-chain fatty acid--CoA ligase [Rectinemataceae bacterium]
MSEHAGELLTRRARLTPEREALYDVPGGRRYSYRELNERACRAANFLREGLGIAKGDRVGIIAMNGVHYVDLLYGLAKIGAILVPFNWRLKPVELEYMVKDCSPKLMIVGPEFVELLDKARPALSCRSYLSLGGAKVEGGSYEEYLASASPSEPPRPPLSEEDPLLILYTSGTTGKSKGAVIPHRQVLWNAINTCISWGLTEDDVAPVFTPYYHAGALFIFMTPLFYNGGRIVIEREFDPDRAIDLIMKEKCSVVLGVPTLFRMWYDSASWRRADFSSVRFFVNGGAAIPAELMDAWRKEKNVVFRQGYGLTEVGVNCMTMTDEESLRYAGSVGKPIFHSEIKLLREDGAEVAAGEPGEICIKGPTTCLGYWNKPEATAAALVDGWFHTGDMGVRNEEGFLWIRGRYKDMIKSGGENIYAAEVETVFREHAAVLECALIGKPDPKWDEVGLMVVVLRKGMEATAGELLAFCKERLANYKVPKEVVFAEALPYSAYGKVVKAELRAKYL